MNDARFERALTISKYAEWALEINQPFAILVRSYVVTVSPSDPSASTSMGFSFVMPSSFVLPPKNGMFSRRITPSLSSKCSPMPTHAWRFFFSSWWDEDRARRTTVCWVFWNFQIFQNPVPKYTDFQDFSMKFPHFFRQVSWKVLVF